jgi:hypothetical protein
LNGRYHAADSAAERIAIAVLAAERKYSVEFPNGVTAGQVFLADYLRPFIERELVAARIEELHHMTNNEIRPRERELVNALAAATRECEQRVNS